ncbi:hypothetical protein H2198_001014 [Neophaeococcomyces mojaviensis]|uniref:Uncharacterized protein n=1 Tax=Neophaeococcomyces mojaviensis TaxID=3383035 RepID=A0ACC3AIL5_9EURO|nr:hypothetical protein H2198_001014 [Knufia sp. JES_112]
MESSISENLSTLEKLPVELIQQVFFLALEINMPRASRHLQQVLSTEPIFRALIAFAYFDDDGGSPVETKHFLPAEYRTLNSMEKVRLQQGILSCRWCTYYRIKSSLPTLTRLVIAQAWHQEHALAESLSAGLDGIQEVALKVANQAIHALAVLPSFEDEVELEKHYFSRTIIEDLGSNGIPFASRNYSDTPLTRIVTWTSSLDDNGVIHKTTDRSLSALAVRHIPNWLLRSKPWTIERLQFLQVLRQGYTFVQDDLIMAISAGAVIEGMKNAIQERHIAALKTLLEIHNSFFKSGAWTFQSMVGPQLTAPSHHPLPVDLFHLALQQRDMASELLSLLLRAGIDSLPKDDEKATAWAVRESSHGNALASWLLSHMEGTSDYGLPRRGHLFVDGCLSWRARARGDFPFPESSFADELGYIKGTTITPAGVNDQVCGND